MTSQIEELGSVTAPTGELVLIDFGCLRDSGWRVFSGDESDSELDDSANITVVPLRDLVAADATLEAVFRTPGPCAFERDPGGDFVAVEYAPPQDLPGLVLGGR